MGHEQNEKKAVERTSSPRLWDGVPVASVGVHDGFCARGEHVGRLGRRLDHERRSMAVARAGAFDMRAPVPRSGRAGGTRQLFQF